MSQSQYTESTFYRVPEKNRFITEDRQCTYNVTLRLVHEAIVAVEK
jgi:hypothetical protein